MIFLLKNFSNGLSELINLKIQNYDEFSEIAIHSNFDDILIPLCQKYDDITHHGDEHSIAYFSDKMNPEKEIAAFKKFFIENDLIL